MDGTPDSAGGIRPYWRYLSPPPSLSHPLAQSGGFTGRLKWSFAWRARCSQGSHTNRNVPLPYPLDSSLAVTETQDGDNLAPLICF